MYNTELPQRAELPGAATLVRSTLFALAVAGALLVTVVMPAEYGIDPTGIGRVTGLKAMGEIKRSAQAAAEAVASPASLPVSASTSAAASATSIATPAASSAATAASATVVAAGSKADQTTVSLKPGEGVEIKMDMEKGGKVQYRWVARGGAVNFDAHGEATGVKFSVSYKKGKDARQDEGTLEAAFTGQHGWYWKNRGKQPVTVELTTSGQYASINRVL